MGADGVWSCNFDPDFHFRCPKSYRLRRQKLPEQIITKRLVLGDSTRPTKVIHQVASAYAHTPPVDQVLNVPVVGVDTADAQIAGVPATIALLYDHVFTAGLVSDTGIGAVAINQTAHTQRENSLFQRR